MAGWFSPMFFFCIELNGQVDVFFLVASVFFWGGCWGFCRELVKRQQRY